MRVRVSPAAPRNILAISVAQATEEPRDYDDSVYPERSEGYYGARKKIIAKLNVAGHFSE